MRDDWWHDPRDQAGAAFDAATPATDPMAPPPAATVPVSPDGPLSYDSPSGQPGPSGPQSAVAAPGAPAAFAPSIAEGIPGWPPHPAVPVPPAYGPRIAYTAPPPYQSMIPAPAEPVWNPMFRPRRLPGEPGKLQRIARERTLGLPPSPYLDALDGFTWKYVTDAIAAQKKAQQAAATRASPPSPPGSVQGTHAGQSGSMESPTASSHADHRWLQPANAVAAMAGGEGLVTSGGPAGNPTTRLYETIASPNPLSWEPPADGQARAVNQPTEPLPGHEHRSSGVAGVSQAVPEGGFLGLGGSGTQKQHNILPRETDPLGGFLDSLAKEYLSRRGIPPAAYDLAQEWHFEERQARNTNLPQYKSVEAKGSEWTMAPEWMNAEHDNGDGLPEIKYMHPDGRDVLRRYSPDRLAS